MLVIGNQERFDFIKNEMEKIGGEVLQSFLDKLVYLDTYASGEGQRYEKEGTKCIVFPDNFKRAYFDFIMYHGNGNGDWEEWFNGGLCYHGPSLAGFTSDPFKPVSLHSSKEGYWSVHT